MGTNTPNYTLYLPDYTESADVGQINANMTKLDAALKPVSDKTNTNTTNTNANTANIASNTAAIAALPKVLTARKTSIFIINNSITLASDPQLNITVKAGKNYIISGYVSYQMQTGAAATGNDAQCRVMHPGGDMYWTMVGPYDGSTDPIDTRANTSSRILASGSAASTAKFATIGDTAFGFTINGTYECDTNGTLGLQFAQVVASPVTLWIQKGTWLRTEEIA